MTEQQISNIDQIVYSLRASIKEDYKNKVNARYAEYDFNAEERNDLTQEALDDFEKLVRFIDSQKRLPSANDDVYDTWDQLQKYIPNLEVRLGIGVQNTHHVEKPESETKESISQQIAQAESLDELVVVLQAIRISGKSILSSEGQDSLPIAQQEIANYLVRNKRINLDLISPNEGLLQKVNELWVNKIEGTFTDTISSLGIEKNVIVADKVQKLISYVNEAIQRVAIWDREVSKKQQGEYVVISPFRGLDANVVARLTEIQREQDDNKRRLMANQLPKEYGIRQTVLNIISNAFLN